MALTTKVNKPKTQGSISTNQRRRGLQVNLIRSRARQVSRKGKKKANKDVEEQKQDDADEGRGETIIGKADGLTMEINADEFPSEDEEEPEMMEELGEDTDQNNNANLVEAEKQMVASQPQLSCSGVVQENAVRAAEKEDEEERQFMERFAQFMEKKGFIQKKGEEMPVKPRNCGRPVNAAQVDRRSQMEHVSQLQPPMGGSRDSRGREIIQCDSEVTLYKRAVPMSIDQDHVNEERDNNGMVFERTQVDRNRNSSSSEEIIFTSDKSMNDS